MQNLDALKQEIISAVTAANDIDTLEDVRVSALGKKGKVTGIMKTLGNMDPDQRREMGQSLNKLIGS